MSIPQKSERLIFRAWRDEDLDSLHAINADPQVMRYVADGQVWPISRTRQFIEAATEMLDRSGFCQWALIHRNSDGLIGFCGLVDTGDIPEIGWRLARACWGQGLATEAASAVLDHARDTLGLTRVMATVQAENVASVRVIEKLGMTQDRIFRRNGRNVATWSRSLVSPLRFPD
jgi:RimJ/RimL family protein N-acetyltransferase